MTFDYVKWYELGVLAFMDTEPGDDPEEPEGMSQQERGAFYDGFQAAVEEHTL